ncbi:hypothetical protein VTK73DRAFT_9344 [Phialemonium thermophilum]|uniref:Molybdate-anion transporter n=1 Tax=Phialemonium thermophilum TaxID=223376 RepID=A0ABR3XL01_9PEZI
MSFYQINLAIFTACNAGLLCQQYRRDRQLPKTVEEALEATPTHIEETGTSPSSSRRDVRKFVNDFFPVYAFAVAADWLQGPYIYAIYRYEKDLSEKMVAALYAAGFVAGAVSASFAGRLADRYGRRLACLVYCGVYTVTCLTMLSNNLVVLLAGRVAGGVATTLLFSVFEAWMITEYHHRGLDEDTDVPGPALRLSSVFGYMTTLSCVVAIVSGIIGDALVASLGGRIWPFMASISCCAIAACLIATSWDENYGAKSVGGNALEDIRSGTAAIAEDKRILALGVASCFFEGAMYLFIFFWSAALKSARAHSSSSPWAIAAADEDLPYGLVFSSFMCAMMAGSSLFSALTPVHTQESAAHVLTTAILVASACLGGAAVLTDERVLFWTLCAVEAAIGLYFPSMSFLKSEIVEDGVRGRVYSILRCPLNAFVVLVHSLDEEGDDHRSQVFLALAALLLSAFVIIRLNFKTAPSFDH